MNMDDEEQGVIVMADGRQQPIALLQLSACAIPLMIIPGYAQLRSVSAHLHSELPRTPESPGLWAQ